MQVIAENLKNIGAYGLLKSDNLEHIDIGFSMLLEYHSKGYGCEEVNEIIKLGKTEFGIKTICAITLPINKPSIGLLEKLGLSYQKTVKPFDDDEELLLFAKDL